MPRHPMPYQWPSESSQEVSPPGSLKSTSSDSSPGTREKVKDAIDNLLNKFSRQRRTSSVSRTSVERRKAKPRAQSLIVLGSERPPPIPVTVGPQMDSYSSTSSKRGKLFRRFSISSASDSIRSAESECSNMSLMQRVQDTVRPDLPQHEIESTPDRPATEMAVQTEPPSGLDDSVIVIAHEEPTDALCEEEASAAPSLPELPPALEVDLDVNVDSASQGPRTPPALSLDPHFILSPILECPESAISPVISTIAAERNAIPTKDAAVIAPVPLLAKREVKSSVPAPKPEARDTSPTLSQYLYSLVAPENLEHICRPIGYSVTAFCYGLTWYLVTQTPSQGFI